jgi:hypothetical protein
VRNHLPIYFGPGEYGDIAPHCIPPPPPANILSKDSGRAFLSQPQTKTQTKTEAVCDVCVVFVCCFCDLRVCLNKKQKVNSFGVGVECMFWKAFSTFMNKSALSASLDGCLEACCEDIAVLDALGDAVNDALEALGQKGIGFP